MKKGLMKYKYTWNHILLLARVCGQVDDEESATSSWVQITEEHNKHTFPFTLWPLTYRTCEVTTSPAMCTPVHIPGTDMVCNYNVKIIKCNEVVIICIQENSPRDSPCAHPCMADLGIVAGSSDSGSNDNNGSMYHADHHSTSKDKPLLPCDVAHCYHQMNTVIKNAFFAIQDATESVICTGHGSAATIASCLASDMSRTYEAEKEFLGLRRRRVSVDFIGFSNHIIASPAYWEECSACIDQYICVVFEGCAPAAASVSGMVSNPRSSRVTLPLLSLPKTSSSLRTLSMLHKIVRMNGKDRRVFQQRSKDASQIRPDRDISEYVAALNNRIILPLVDDW